MNEADFSKMIQLSWEYRRPEKPGAKPKTIWRLRFTRYWEAKRGVRRSVGITEFYFRESDLDERIAFLKTRADHKVNSVAKYTLAK